MTFNNYKGRDYFQFSTLKKRPFIDQITFLNLELNISGTISQNRISKNSYRKEEKNGLQQKLNHGSSEL